MSAKSGFLPFRKAAVLGAGVMGAQIAAHLANAGLEVLLLDIPAPKGTRNAFAAGADRYPHVDLADIDRDGVDEVWLPDEPYVFTGDDGPEAFERVPTRLVSGRLITWYGPAMVEAHRVLRL